MPSFITRKKLKQPESEKPKKSHPILRWAGRFFMGIGILVFLSMMLSLISFIGLIGGAGDKKPLPDQFILGIGLYGSMPDVTDQNPLLAQFMPPETSLLDFLRSVNHAKTDDRVKAIAVRIYDGGYSLTQTETIREAIADFRASGKKVYIFTDSFGGFSNGIGEYWLATAFDEIWVQPVGLVSLSGIRIEQPYFAEGLEKLGIEMQMEQRKAFKTGPEMYLRNTMSEASEIALKAVIADIMNTMISQITESRDVDAARLKAAINNSPLMVEEALNIGLIDKVGHMDEFEEMVKAAVYAGNADADTKAEDIKFVPLARYNSEPYKHRKTEDKKVEVAVIQVNGAILETPEVSSSSPKAFLVPDDVADAKDIAGAIHAAGEDDNIKVIILRINSPGGAPGASETIRRAVVKAKEEGKYVIASMGDTAASGGYWIAVNADTIIAGKLTLTGSIGVYGGKPNLSDMWDKIGVSWQALEYGQNASMWSSNVGYSDAERARLDAMMDRVYEAFTARVAEGRNMTDNAVEEVAQGRVWTGLDAQPRNLVDALGGFETALKMAADKIGNDNWHMMPIAILPKHDDPLADIANMLGIPLSADLPTLPQTFIPSFYPEAIVTAPPLRIDF